MDGTRAAVDPAPDTRRQEPPGGDEQRARDVDVRAAWQREQPGRERHGTCDAEPAAEQHAEGEPPYSVSSISGAVMTAMTTTVSAIEGVPSEHGRASVCRCTGFISPPRVSRTMVPYEAFDEGVEVNGQTVLRVVDEAMGRFSETYRDGAFAALAAEGIVDPEPAEWYPQQAWLNAFEAIADDLEPHVLDRLGEQIPSVAEWPTGVDTVPDGLRSIDDAYRRNHQGGEIGSYEFEQLDEQTGTVACHTPYPCPFDRGLIRGVTRQYAPVGAFVFIEETGTECRRDGGETCTYTVHW